MKMDTLYRHAADLDVMVEWVTDLPDTRHGVYLDDERVIRLNHRLTSAQALGALAHELAHAVAGDRCSTGAIERRADEVAAALIISRDEYAEAEEIVGPHAGAIALELGVTRRMVLAWRRWFTRHRSTEGESHGVG